MKLIVKCSEVIKEIERDYPSEIICRRCGSEAKPDRETTKSHIWIGKRNIRYICPKEHGTQRITQS